MKLVFRCKGYDSSDELLSVFTSSRPGCNVCLGAMEARRLAGSEASRLCCASFGGAQSREVTLLIKHSNKELYHIIDS